MHVESIDPPSPDARAHHEAPGADGRGVGTARGEQNRTEDTDAVCAEFTGSPTAAVQHMIPENRASKQFYRDRLASAAARDYQRLREFFTDGPWAIGLPRFMFKRAATDAIGYVASQLTYARDKALDYELRLRRFWGRLRAANRQRVAELPEGNSICCPKRCVRRTFAVERFRGGAATKLAVG
jgi:hypothetical protein